MRYPVAVGRYELKIEAGMSKHSPGAILIEIG